MTTPDSVRPKISDQIKKEIAHTLQIAGKKQPKDAQGNPVYKTPEGRTVSFAQMVAGVYQGILGLPESDFTKRVSQLLTLPAQLSVFKSLQKASG